MARMACARRSARTARAPCERSVHRVLSPARRASDRARVPSAVVPRRRMDHGVDARALLLRVRVHGAHSLRAGGASARGTARANRRELIYDSRTEVRERVAGLAVAPSSALS